MKHIYRLQQVIISEINVFVILSIHKRTILTYISTIICRAIIIFCSYGILEVFVLLSCDKWFCVVHKVFHVRTSSDNTTWEKRSMSNANILRLKIKASLALDLLLSNSHYFQER